LRDQAAWLNIKFSQQVKLILHSAHPLTMPPQNSISFYRIVSSFLPFVIFAANCHAIDPISLASQWNGFKVQPSGQTFTPWGFNYDHDEQSRLIEDYWNAEWKKVEADFGEMKALGANCVRVHLQFAKFMNSAGEPNEAALVKLGELIELAERTGLYLDLTGLGCYHKKDVPAWYDALGEAGRWEAQAAFWRAVASRCAASPAIFCYDLMNEPVVPGKGDRREDWLGKPFGDKTFVQFISRDIGDRERYSVARAWIHNLVSAIREIDQKHLITVGLVDWSLDRSGLTSGFVPEKIAQELDFLCAHIYPVGGKISEALEKTRAFAACGKPVVIEETFPLKCSTKEFDRFIRDSHPAACGWIGFYWGATIDELESNRKRSIAISITLGCLKYFMYKKP